MSQGANWFEVAKDLIREAQAVADIERAILDTLCGEHRDVIAHPMTGAGCRDCWPEGWGEGPQS